MTKHGFNAPYINYFLPAKMLLLVPIRAFMKTLLKGKQSLREIAINFFPCSAYWLEQNKQLIFLGNSCLLICKGLSHKQMLLILLTVKKVTFYKYVRE